MKIARLPAIAALLFFTVGVLCADVSNTWQFLVEENYGYDPILIGVDTNPPGQAELLLQEDEEYHATFAEYTATNATRANLQMGFPVSIEVTKDPAAPELYNSLGIFISRIIRSEVGFSYVVNRISNADHTGDPTLVGFYKMDNDSWVDAVSGQLAQPQGSPQFTTDAKQGTHAGRFDDSMLQLAGRPLNGARAMTVAAWAKTVVWGNRGVVVGHYTDWRLRDIMLLDTVSGPGIWRAYLRINGKLSETTAFAGGGGWAFLVFTWDSAGDGKVRLYLNGQLASVASGAATSSFYNEGPLTIGSDTGPTSGNALNGIVDGVGLWKRALSSTEISDLYESYRITQPVRFQFRSAQTEAAITNKVFVGPRGTTDSYYFGDRFALESAGEFDVGDPYLQYKVELFSSQNRVNAPLLQAVGVDVGGAMAVDKLHLDFLGAGYEFKQNTVNTAIQADKDWSYLGLSKKPNGGYYTNGVFYSRAFGSEDEVVTWDRISWTEGGKEISRATTAGLIGLYHCRSSWADDSGSGHSGTPQPSVTYTDVGKLGGRSAIFNGVDAYVSAFSYGDSPVRSMEFWINNGNVDDAIMQVDADSAIMIRDRMIAVTGFTGAKPKIYVNSRPVAGPLLQGWNHVALIWPDTITAIHLEVGRTDGATPDYMQGMLDELALYNRVLQPSELVEHYTVGRREVAGTVKFQVRSSNDPTFRGVPFIGPQGTESSYFTLAGAIPSDPAPYFQYAAYLNGNGDGTPALTSVTIGYDLLSRSYTDASVDDFGDGTSVGGTVRTYGQKMDLEDQGFLGPANMSRLDFPSLIGLWHLDEEVWGAIVDELGAGTGSASGGAQTSADTYIGTRCGMFDGVNDRVVLGNSPFAVTTFSASLWFRSTTDNRRALLSSYIAGGQYLALEVNSDGASSTTGRVAFVIDDAFFGPVSVASRRTGLNDGVWHNVIGMRNGRQLLIYVDGALEGTATLNAFYGDANGSSPSLGYDSRLGYYQGYIDEVALFSSALTRKQISQICGAGVRTLDTGEFSGPTVTAPDATIWDVIDWGVHSVMGTPLPDSADSLVALWHMDEPAGAATVVDAVGGHDGDLTGNAGVSGKFGQAIQLGGSSRVLVSDAADLEPQRLSVEAWVFPSEPIAMAIVDKRTATTGYALGMDAEGRPYFWVGDGVGGVTALSPVGLRVGQWGHVAGTYDGSNVRLYVDGRPRAETALSIGDAETQGQDLLIGMSYQAGDHFAGQLDEVAIHNRAVRGPEIEDHYAAGVVKVRFQARSWEPDPIGEYVGPGGTNNTYFTEWYGSITKGSLPLGRNLQYKALMTTEDYRFSPAMYGIHVAYSSYPLGNPPINPADAAAFPFLANLTEFSDSKSAFDGTDVRYQISGDTGRTTNRWFYWDTFGATQQWAEATGKAPAYTYSSSASTINRFIDRFYSKWYNGVGGNFRFRAFLHSSGDQPTELYNVTLKASEGRIVITAPNGLERGDDAWLVGTAYEITWTHAGNVTGTVRLDYSLDGGENWIFIADGIAATADRYPWTTPGRGSDNALIRILHQQDATIYDYSDGPFELIARYRVLAPNGGEKWYIGELNNIIWGASAGLGDVSIDYSGDGDWSDPVKIGDFIKSIPGVNTNRYAWRIQTNEPDLPSTNGSIRLQTFGGSGTDYSDAPFTVAGAAFTFPQAGAFLNRGIPYTISWNSAECGSNMIFEAQTTANGPWEMVNNSVSNSPGPNSYVWTITNPPSEVARVRLTSTSDPRAKGISDVFTIAALVVITPNGDFDPLKSERWLMESTKTVEWISAGVNDEVNIRFSPDGGNTWTLIAEDVPNSNEPDFTNSYTFSVPPIPSDQARIRVEDSVRTNELWDMSDYDFQVAGVSITYPNGPVSQEWLYDEVGTIQWLENAVGPNAIVEFSYDGGVTYENIRGVAGAQVNLGDGESPPYWPHTPTVRGLVRITPTEPAPFSNVVDTSDSFFTVAGVKIEAPVSGDQYKIGDTTPITWIAAGTHDPEDALDIYYSGDGETFDRTPEGAIRLSEIFSEEYPGRQSYQWTVERKLEPSNKARIMIKAGVFEQISDAFTVKGIRFNVPVPGSIVAAGPIDIEWSRAGFTFDAAGDITLSTEGEVDSLFTNKLTATPVQVQLGETPWTVPVGIEPTTNAVLKFEVTAAPTLPEDVGFTAYSESFTLQGLGVKQPAAGDAWSLGTTRTIRWRAAEAGDTLDIFYSSDGGATYDVEPVAQVVSSADGYNTHDWMVEMWRLPSNQARLKLVSSSGIETESAVFTMEGIQILRPVATDVYAITDATNRIDWVAIGDNGPYVLEYFTNGVGPFPITTVSGGTEWNWSIPAAAVSTGTQVRVTGSTYTNLSAPFQVVDAPTVIFRAPLAGAFWPVGSTQMVEWSRGGTMPNDFTVEVSIAPYASTTVVANGAMSYDADRNVFQAPWAVPDRLTQARFFVTHNTQPGIDDVSGEFNMVGTFEVRSPNGGNTLYALKPVPVIWRTIGSVPAVNIYYSITPPYRASSWIKVNSTPIANNIKADFEAEQTSWPWTVANLRSSLARIRVQEAQYTQLFDAGASGPFDDSDGPFNIDYYTIHWLLRDATSSNLLDNLSVVDSSGWSASGLSAIPPSTIVREYPWGSWNTEWYREFYNDKAIVNWSSENLALGSPPVWTQQLFMTRSQNESDYKVMANFAYRPATSNFFVSSWMERGGVVMDKPSNTRIYVYEEQGNLLPAMPVVNSSPAANGVFATLVDASGMDRSKVYFARVEIEYSGKYYSAGVTFQISVSAGEEIVAEISQQLSNVQSNLTSEVRAVGTAVAEFRDEAMGELTNMADQVDIIATNTAALGDAMGTNQVGILGTLTNIAAGVERLETDSVDTLARILTQPETMAQGSTNTILYKTRGTYADDAVTMRIYNDRTGAPVGNAITMTRIVGGIYQYTLEIGPTWPLGTYSIECTDPGSLDRISFRVVPYDVYTDMGQLISDMSSVERSVSNLNASVGAITNLGELASKISDMTGTFGDLSSNVTQLMTVTDGLESNVLDLVDRIGTLDLSVLATNVLQLSSNVSDMVVQLGGVDLAEMAGNVSNTLNAVNGLQELSSLTNTLQQFQDAVGDDLALLTSNLTDVAGSLQGVDFNQMMGFVSNIYSEVDGGLTGGVGGVSGSLSNLADNVSAMMTAVQRVDVTARGVSNTVGVLNEIDLYSMESKIYGMSTNLDLLIATPGLAQGLTNLADIVDGLGDLTDLRSGVSNIVDQLLKIEGLPEVSTNVAKMTAILEDFGQWPTNFQAAINKIDGLNLDQMEGQLSNVVNILEKMDADALAATISGLTNQMARVDFAAMGDNITNVLARVRALDTDEIAGALAGVTNALGGTDFSEMGGNITNLLWRMQQMDLGEVTTALAGVTNALGGADLGTMSSTLSNVLSMVFGIGDVQGLSSNVTALVQQMGTIQGLASVDFSALPRIEQSLGSAALGDMLSTIEASVGTLDSDLAAVASQLQGVGGGVQSAAENAADAASAASKANQTASTAKTAASDASTQIKALRDAIEQGNLEQSMALLQRLRASVTAIQEELAAVPKGELVQEVYSSMSQMAVQMQAFAASRGYEWLTGMQEVPEPLKGGAEGEGGVPGDTDEEMIGTLNKNMQEMKISMEFMQELLDEMAYEPVVKEDLMGVAE